MASSCIYVVPKFGSTSFCDQNCCVESADIHTQHTDRQKVNKAISMMRVKSPRSDVEMSKKLNFVAAILVFWRPSWIDNSYLMKKIWSIERFLSELGPFEMCWSKLIDKWPPKFQDGRSEI